MHQNCSAYCEPMAAQAICELEFLVQKMSIMGIGGKRQSTPRKKMDRHQCAVLYRNTASM